MNFSCGLNPFLAHANELLNVPFESIRVGISKVLSNVRPQLLRQRWQGLRPFERYLQKIDLPMSAIVPV
jgi:hypothetical protein